MDIWMLDGELFLSRSSAHRHALWLAQCDVAWMLKRGGYANPQVVVASELETEGTIYSIYGEGILNTVYKYRLKRTLD